MTKDEMLNLKKEAIRKHKAGEYLALDETAYAMWNPEHEPKPMTAMGILKIERRALDKLKLKLKSRYNVNGLDDIFDPRHREIGRQNNTKEI